MEVEVADIRVALIEEAVDDERRHARERAGRHSDPLVVDAEPDLEETLEDVEEVRVVSVDVQVGAVVVRAQTPQRRPQSLMVGEDLDPPVDRVADDLVPRATRIGSLTRAEYASTSVRLRRASGRAEAARR